MRPKPEDMAAYVSDRVHNSVRVRKASQMERRPFPAMHCPYCDGTGKVPQGALQVRAESTVANWRSPDFSKHKGSAATLCFQPGYGYLLYLFPPGTSAAQMETHKFDNRDEALRAHAAAVARYSQ